jgi:hypothetical protein
MLRVSCFNRRTPLSTRGGVGVIVQLMIGLSGRFTERT